MHRAWAACAYLYVFVSRYLSVTGILICVGYLYVVLYYPYMCANKFVNLSCPIRLEINFKCYLYVVRMLFLGHSYAAIYIRLLLVCSPYVTRRYSFVPICYPFVPVWCFSQDRKGYLPGTRGYVVYSQTPEAKGQLSNMLIFHLCGFLMQKDVWKILN